MSFDPQREDYERLGLRFARSLDNNDPANAAHAFATFGRRFAQDRDSLPQSDSDRAFHLVAEATRLIDYELPFATEDRAAKIIDNGHRLLDEALAIDPTCYDALRMKAAAQSNSFEGFLEFLAEQSPVVRATCEEQRDEALKATISANTGERVRLAADLAMRPYLRWIASWAEQALICGRNKESLRIAQQALDEDPHDKADVRFTMTLAYAKLEDEDGLEVLIQSNHTAGRIRPADDPWTLLARLALAHKRLDMDAAGKHLDTLLATFPHAAEALLRQIELPDGVFSRLSVLPYSEDELILAISEATVLLQEGFDTYGKGVLSSWIMQETMQRRPQAALSLMTDFQDGRNGGDKPTSRGEDA